MINTFSIIYLLTALLPAEPNESPCMMWSIQFTGENNVNVLRTDVMIPWRYNDNYARCEEPKPPVDFKIQIQTILEETLFSDSIRSERIDSIIYHIPKNLIASQDFLVITIDDTKNSGDMNLALTIQDSINIPVNSSRVDSLNYFFEMGYEFNAIPMVMKDYPHLIPKLFARNSTRGLFISETSELLNYPTILKDSGFEKQLNKETKAEYHKGVGFQVYLTISEQGEVVDIIVSDDRYKDIINSSIGNLEFSNENEEEVRCIIDIGRSKDLRKYYFKNESSFLVEQ